jgi:hypothetical protein
VTAASVPVTGSGPVPSGRLRPAPLVGPWPQLGRFLAQRVQLLVVAVVLAYFGQLVIVAVYYLLLETNPSVTHAWHTVALSGGVRHDIRNNVEGLLGGLFAQAAVWNAFRRRRPMTALDRIERGLHIPNLKTGHPRVGQLVATVPLVIAYAVPGYLLARAGTDLLQSHAVDYFTQLRASSRITSLTPVRDRLVDTAAGDWDQKLRGYAAAFLFGRRPAKATIDAAQLRLAQRHVRRNRALRWWHPPTFAARVTTLRGHVAALHHPILETLVIRFGALTLAALAVTGLWVLVFHSTTG